MLKAGLSWATLASICGTTTGRLRRIKAGNIRDGRTEKHIANWLRLPVHVLFDPLPSTPLAITDDRWAKFKEANRE